MDDTGALAEVSIGTLYGSGKFGTDSRTSILTTALGARLRLSDLRLSASLPFMRIRSRSTIFTGIDGVPILVAGNTHPVRHTADGFGDLTLGASYTVAPSSSSTEVEFSARAKINTATRSSGLSSGENDYALDAQVTRTMGRLAPFASVTYRFLGDTPQYRLRDGFAASAGSSYSFGERTFVLASYHYARAATPLVHDAHELFAGLSSSLRQQPLRVTGFVTTGLSSGAAAVSGGVALSFGFGGRHATL